MSHDDQMRASDGDRQRIADRLRLATDEGRLSLGEYDERLDRAFKAQTYADLNALVADLPAPAGEEKSRVVPVEASRDVRWDWRRDRRERRRRGRRGLRSGWGGWLGFSVFLTGIWFVSRLSDISEKGWAEGVSGHGFWPMWPIAGIGLLMLARTIGSMFGDRDD
ncbi:MAG TPA: DUF1707 domain-containing protein [Phytomonospora sp.]